jgi:primosomal replication protein N
MNHVELSACLAEVSALRYTPAGLPALDLWLEHESELEESGQKRQVKANVRSIALGQVAERLVPQKRGSLWRFTGFVASPRNSKSLVFHIQDFQPIA